MIQTTSVLLSEARLFAIALALPKSLRSVLNTTVVLLKKSAVQVMWDSVDWFLKAYRGEPSLSTPDDWGYQCEQCSTQGDFIT